MYLIAVLAVMVCNCFGTENKKQVHSDSNAAEHAQALEGAEELLKTNASKLVTDVYTLEATIGTGAFAKVVRCFRKVIHCSNFC